MAEVAHAATGRPVAALEGIRVLAGITLADDGIAVHADATPAGDAVDVALAAADQPGRVRYRSRALLRAAAPPAAPAPLDGAPAFPMPVADAYRDLLFHGPLFQRVVSVEAMDERGLSAVVRSSAPGARWWLDPVTVDCALQLQVVWARLHWDVTLLPAEIGGARVFAPLVGDAVRLELRVRPEAKPPLCHCDHVFLGPDNRVLATLTDVVGTGSKALNRLAGVAAARAGG